MLQLRQASKLWLLGFLDSLQLHKCVVFMVLDTSGLLPAKVSQCLLLNGCIFLGSILLWTQALAPGLHWVLMRMVAPVWGGFVASATEAVLQLVFHGAWLLPTYLVALFVGCTWYQDVATHAYKVQQQQRKGKARLASATVSPNSTGASGTDRMGPGAHGADVKRRASSSSCSNGSSKLEDVAQELYRVLFFLIFYAEVWLFSKLPYIGPVLNAAYLSWLYAYYCFDYKWSITRVPLAERITYFEQRWAYFSGFGMLMALSSVVLPFYIGAAVLSAAFPLYVILACDAEVEVAHSAGGGAAMLTRLPIFNLALAPTQTALQRLMGSKDLG